MQEILVMSTTVFSPENYVLELLVMSVFMNFKAIITSMIITKSSRLSCAWQVWPRDGSPSIKPSFIRASKTRNRLTFVVLSSDIPTIFVFRCDSL